MLPGATHGLPAFVREVAPGQGNGVSARRLYISAGIHGDEPASPLAALALLRQNEWPDHLSIHFCPCLNPDGFDLNTRENPSGIDLNRQYRTPRAGETIAHIHWLKRQPRFDLALCLHEDWESSGFYVYELNPDNQPSIAPTIIEAAERVCPVERSDIIEGWPANGGIIRPGANPEARPDWPEAFYLVMNKTRMSYTLESPSDYPPPVRTGVLVEAARAAAFALADPRGAQSPPASQ
jgi:hypothetical protein